MRLTRRDLLLSAASAWSAARLRAGEVSGEPAAATLSEYGYGDVSLESPLHQSQLRNTHEVLMSLSEDSLLKPFRQLAGRPAPGADLGGWYDYRSDFDWRHGDGGFAPGATFGQWVSSLARYHAMTGAPDVRAKVLRLNQLYARAISENFYDQNRFPAYCYDKLLLGLIDSHQFAGDADAFRVLERTTQAALPHLPAHAVERELAWRPGKDQSYRWDESYTNPENLFLAYQRGAGERYRDLGVRFLDDATWFEPLARNENVLAPRHAYSYVNSLSSAMQAYLTLGSEKHLRAARNAFTMLAAQSYPTGGWGPDEKLVTPDSGELHASLSSTHNSFETPCGAYAHFKLTRYLLRVTRDPRFGDSMERVMYNTVLGARPLQTDGRAFYYADYHFSGRKVYSTHRFPCCSGTLPQVATDYGINSYFHDTRGIYVNLYIPSTLRFRSGGAQGMLQQRGDYPFSDRVTMSLQLSRPETFTVHLRIPAWTEQSHIELNGRRWSGAQEPGSFAAITREWRSGDRLDIVLPSRLRLEGVDARHPATVALLSGPLVLFALTPDGSRLEVQREELLAARQTAPQRWEAQSGSSTIAFAPYVAIADEPYSTFVNLKS